MSVQKFLIGGAVVTLYVTVSLTAYRLQRIRNLDPPHPHISLPSHQRLIVPQANRIFDDLSNTYDEKINSDEFLLGISSKREELLKHAKVLAR